jgi:uncharacterized protein (TIGR02453 family)
MTFDGFPPEALDFLAGLERNNERAWFEARRAEYERALLDPARALVVALGGRLEAFAPGIRAEPRVNGSILRINRDTRFSSDKRPYKTHLDLWFWHGAGPSRLRPGYFLRLTAARLLLGAGMHRFERDALLRYREAVCDPARGAALAAAAEAVRASGFTLGGARYRRVPAGFEAPEDVRSLLLHEGLFAYDEAAMPPEAHDERFPDYCAARFRALAPLVEWLAAILEPASEGANA